MQKISTYLFYILPQLNSFCQCLRHFPDIMTTLTASFSHSNSSATKTVILLCVFFLTLQKQVTVAEQSFKIPSVCLFCLKKFFHSGNTTTYVENMGQKEHAAVGLIADFRPGPPVQYTLCQISSFVTYFKEDISIYVDNYKYFTIRSCLLQKKSQQKVEMQKLISSASIAYLFNFVMIILPQFMNVTTSPSVRVSASAPSISTLEPYQTGFNPTSAFCEK